MATVVIIILSLIMGDFMLSVTTAAHNITVLIWGLWPGKQEQLPEKMKQPLTTFLMAQVEIPTLSKLMD